MTQPGFHDSCHEDVGSTDHSLPSPQGSIGKEALLSTSVSWVNELMSCSGKKDPKPPHVSREKNWHAAKNRLGGVGFLEICVFMFNPYLGDIHFCSDGLRAPSD